MLPAGTRLGSYEILSKLGEGGMGQVYRAIDTTLKRSVALKVLPPAFANDPDRMERMRREAQVLASLSHPNIAAIHGVEGSALVMEFVDGVNLGELTGSAIDVAPSGSEARQAAGVGPRGKLSKAGLSLGQALQHARQIADALEHAHEKGIIHRDLKPANIKITPDGHVKVLDFGLAKVVEERPTPIDPTNSPTLTIRATEAGLILGTAAYMAPEQARGAAVDRRADIWSFGVVLYELITGRMLFPGETVSDTLAGVLKGDIDLATLPPETPPAIRTLLRRCLERDRKKRLQAIGEARIVIDDVLSGGTPAPEAAPETAARPVGWMIASAALALLAIAGLAVAVIHWRETPPVVPVVEFDITPPPELGELGPFHFPVVSPDGRYIALTGPRGLVVRPIGSRDFIALDTTAPARTAFWSPDSRFIAYARGGNNITRVPATGGAPQVLVALPFFPVAGAWGPNGTILISAEGGAIYRTSETGDPPVPVTSINRGGDVRHAVRAFLPDGRRFIFLERRGVVAAGALMVGSLDSPDVVPLIEGVSGADYVATSERSGLLLFMRDGELLAQPIDPGALRLFGEPVRARAGLSTTIPGFSVSNNGVLAVRIDPVQETELVWVNRSGQPLGTIGQKGLYSNPVLSPDERWLAVARAERAGGPRDIWVIDLPRQTSSRLTTGADDETNPVWSADGQTVFYSQVDASAAPGARNLYRRAASGVGQPALVFKSDEAKNAEDLSADGQFLLYNVASREIWRVPAAGTGQPELVLRPPDGRVNYQQAQISPDGRWVAYRSQESGRDEVYVQSYPSGPHRRQISNNGGGEPRWRPDGRELFYVSADRLMAVSIAGSASGLDAGLPQPLFTTSLEAAGRRNRYLAAANGQRFLVVRRAAVATTPRITVLLNWATTAR